MTVSTHAAQKTQWKRRQGISKNHVWGMKGNMEKRREEQWGLCQTQWVGQGAASLQSSVAMSSPCPPLSSSLPLPVFTLVALFLSIGNSFVYVLHFFILFSVFETGFSV